MASTSFGRASCWSALALVLAAACGVGDRDVQVKGPPDGGSGGSDTAGSGGRANAGGSTATDGGSGGLAAQGGGGGGGGGGTGGGDAATGDGDAAAGGAGDSGGPDDPDGYVRSGRWHGWTWTQTSPGASIAPPSFVERPLCASGTVPPTIDASGFARLGVNLNQAVGPGTPPASGVVPTESGVVVDVSNKAVSPLLLELISNITGDSWCLPIYGKGGYYPWSSFKSRCMTPGGAPYSGRQAITGLAILVPGNTETPVSFDFCLNEFHEASSGFVGSCNATNPVCSPALIDDLEGAEDGTIYSQDGRSGYWVTYHDGSSDAGAPAATRTAPGHLSAHAMQSQGSGFTVWGAGMGVRLNDPPGAEQSHAYDASRYDGIQFWYRSETAISFRVRTLATTSISDTFIAGGTCSLSVGDCASFLVALPAAATWTEVNLTWAEITQPVWSLIAGTVIDPATLIEIRFESLVNDTFDYRVDDLSFF